MNLTWCWIAARCLAFKLEWAYRINLDVDASLSALGIRISTASRNARSQAKRVLVPREW
ncbi:hypothetical protein WI665_14795 [Vibrio cholerae]